MKTKDIYNKPEIEVIDLISEGVIAASTGDEVGFTEDAYEGGGARSKRRFWEDSVIGFLD